MYNNSAKIPGPPLRSKIARTGVLAFRFTDPHVQAARCATWPRCWTWSVRSTANGSCRLPVGLKIESTSLGAELDAPDAPDEHEPRAVRFVGTAHCRLHPAGTAYSRHLHHGPPGKVVLFRLLRRRYFEQSDQTFRQYIGNKEDLFSVYLRACCPMHREVVI